MNRVDLTSPDENLGGVDDDLSTLLTIHKSIVLNVLFLPLLSCAFQAVTGLIFCSIPKITPPTQKRTKYKQKKEASCKIGAHTAVCVMQLRFVFAPQMSLKAQ